MNWTDMCWDRIELDKEVDGNIKEAYALMGVALFIHCHNTRCEGCRFNNGVGARCKLLATLDLLEELRTPEQRAITKAKSKVVVREAD